MFGTDFETDKESERQWIVSSAQRQREKWPPETAPHPGYKRRSARSWYHIGNRLAAVQEAYDSCDEFYPKHLIQRALMAIWPAVMPYRWPPSRKLSRRQIKQARSRIEPVLFSLFAMAAKRGFASRDFDFPRISIRSRKKPERMETSTQQSSQRRRQWEEEVIGRSVLLEYRRHPPGRRSIESAIIEIARLESIEGVSTNSVRSVRARYHAFRRLAFERGYADTRAYWCEWEGQPWPDDQVWLEDFPELD